MSNIHLFNLAVYKIVKSIMEQFPATTTIDLKTLLEEEKELDLRFQYEISCNSYQWLMDNGYIQQKSGELGMVKHFVSPTDKLLFALNSIPEALAPQKRTILDFIMGGVKEGTYESIKDAVKMLIGAGVSLH